MHSSDKQTIVINDRQDENFQTQKAESSVRAKNPVVPPKYSQKTEKEATK